MSDPKFCWLGPRAGDALGLLGMGQVTHIVAREWGDEADLVSARTGARLLALEQVSGWRGTGTRDFSEQGAAELLVPEIARGGLGGEVILVPYRAGALVEEVARQQCLRLAAARVELVHAADSNLALRRELARFGIPHPRGVVARAGTVSYREVARQLGPVFYAKYDLSSAGSGCRRIEGPESFAALRPVEDVVFSEAVPGPSVNFHGVVTASGAVRLFPPSAQLVGVAECTSSATAYCGNDFGAVESLSRSALVEAAATVERTGAMLAASGYRGVFGTDLLLSASGPVLVDLNPRFQGSTHLLDAVQALAGASLATELHVAACLGWSEWSPGEWEPGPAAAISQIVLSHDEADVTATGAMRAGVFRLCGGAMTRLRDGVGALEIDDPANEFVVTGGVPRRGLRLRAGAQICRLLFRQGVFDARSGQLTPFARAATAAVRGRLSGRGPGAGNESGEAGDVPGLHGAAG